MVCSHFTVARFYMQWDHIMQYWVGGPYWVAFYQSKVLELVGPLAHEVHEVMLVGDLAGLDSVQRPQIPSINVSI